MSKTRLTLQAFALLAFMLALTSIAQAQATRTWVSGVGDDVNPCSRTAPCKTWAGAISKTATGGEIDALDPGGFGTLTITKAITIEGTKGQGFGSTLASGAPSGFTINITTNLTSDKVILRNLSINGAGTTLGVDGIRFLDGDSLTVENVDIFNFSGDAIDVNQVQGCKLVLRNVTVNNTGFGVKMTTSAGEVLATIEDCSIRDLTALSNFGINAIANTRVALRNTTVVNATTGVGTSGANSFINADDIFVSYCTTGVSGGGGGVVNLSDSLIAQNGTGVAGTVHSFQGNSLVNNGAPGAFTSTTNKQ